jgi:hypothetical protein
MWWRFAGRAAVFEIGKWLEEVILKEVMETARSYEKAKKDEKAEDRSPAGYQQAVLVVEFLGSVIRPLVVKHCRGSVMSSRVPCTTHVSTGD